MKYENEDKTISVSQINISNPSTESIPIVIKEGWTLTSCAQGLKCEEWFFCYNSQYSGMWPNAIVMGPQEWDLMCHKTCTNNSECPGWECREVDIIWWDVVMKESFCIEDSI